MSDLFKDFGQAPVRRSAARLALERSASRGRAERLRREADQRSQDERCGAPDHLEQFERLKRDLDAE